MNGEMVPGAESRIPNNALILLRYSCAILLDTSGITSKILRREIVRQRSPLSAPWRHLFERS